MLRVGTFILIFLVILCSNLHPQTLPIDNDFYSYQNRIVERLIDQGIIEMPFQSSKPYKISDIKKALDEIDHNVLSELDKITLNNINTLRYSLNKLSCENRKAKYNLDLSSEGIHPQTGKSYSAESIRGNIILNLNDNLNVFTEFALDENLADDPLYNGKVWHSFAGQVERAYLEFDFDKVQFYAGREKSVWGPGRRGNLILSSNSQAMDQIKFSAEIGPVKFTSFTAILDKEENLLEIKDTTIDWDINRYISAHRLEVMPAKNFSIGFSESVLYGGAGRNLELYYTNPLTWYHGEQLNKNKDDNTFIGFDAVWYPLQGLKLYGEMLIDDIQIEDKVASDSEPSEIGYLTGLNLIEPINGTGLDLSFEYTRINNWTYNQNKTYNRYIHDNKIIGHFLGPDRESYYLSAKKWFSFGAWVIFSYERQNSGEHNVFSDWDEPWLYTSPSHNDGFPSGVIEKLDIIGVSIKVFHWNNLQFDVDNYFYFYDNKDNIEGAKSSNYRGRFQIRYLFGFSG